MNAYTPNGRDLRADVAPYLLGEELLWVGQPHTTRIGHVQPFTLIFLVIWNLIAVFIAVAALTSAAGLGIFALLFPVFGLTMLYNLLVGDRKRLQATVYAVTDRRALILYPGKGGSMNCTEYLLANLPSLGVEDVNGENGTIRFQEEPMVYRNGRRVQSGYGQTARITYAFYSIDNVHAVYRLISERAGK